MRDWVVCLEWHRNGFPHWHLTIDVTVQGKRGMIGGDNLRQYWPIGGVRETPIKSKAHWYHLTGYFKKHGYFEKKKAHQGMLPKWAKEGTKRIRRSDSMRRIKPVSKIMPPMSNRPGENPGSGPGPPGRPKVIKRSSLNAVPGPMSPSGMRAGPIGISISSPIGNLKPFRGSMWKRKGMSPGWKWRTFSFFINYTVPLTLRIASNTLTIRIGN